MSAASETTADAMATAGKGSHPVAEPTLGSGVRVLPSALLTPEQFAAFARSAEESAARSEAAARKAALAAARLSLGQLRERSRLLDAAREGRQDAARARADAALYRAGRMPGGTP